MKKIVIALAVLSVFACRNRNHNNNTSTSDELLQIEASTNSALLDPVADNPRREVIYEGVLPAADGPGIRYNLQLWKELDGIDSVYNLDMTYLEAENGEDKTFSSKGEWRTVHHLTDGDRVIIYRLIPNSDDRPMELLLRGDSLKFLDQDRRLIQSEHNYTLVRIK
ncbi:MAG: copper resistance protein NlpE N-terminal domain-containing protein [Rikenellaceae bacterium]|nr:copper resistance protein NlpE N-terminal domain-containing protein [Rikenellaceae bacterium]